VPTGPPVTVEQLAAEFAAVAGTEPVKVRTIPAVVVRAAGLFSPERRELPEMLYQFERPFVIDATETTDMFGIVPTPLADQLRATIDAYRQPSAGAATG
jgi:nucleoside-diphosphate-sugar epimerase